MDHVFVMGKVPGVSAEQMEALVAEQSAHGDLLEVNCQENCMNRGKTFLMYRRMFELVWFCA